MYWGVIFSIIIPVLSLIMFVIKANISYKGNKYFKTFYIYTSFLYCLIYFQPGMFGQCIGAIACRTIGDRRYVTSHVLFECDNDVYKYFTIFFMVPITVTLVIVIPGLILLKMTANQRNSSSLIEKKNFIFLEGEYKKEAYFWEFVKIYLKLGIMLILTFFQ